MESGGWAVWVVEEEAGAELEFGEGGEARAIDTPDGPVIGGLAEVVEAGLTAEEWAGGEEEGGCVAGVGWGWEIAAEVTPEGVGTAAEFFLGEVVFWGVEDDAVGGVGVGEDEVVGGEFHLTMWTDFRCWAFTLLHHVSEYLVPGGA